MKLIDFFPLIKGIIDLTEILDAHYITADGQKAINHFRRNDKKLSDYTILERSTGLFILKNT